MSRLIAVFLLLVAVLGVVACAQETDIERPITGKNLFEIFHRGGILMWPILACSVVAVAFIFERVAGLRATRIFPSKLANTVRALVREGKVAEATDLCHKNSSPFARLLEACLGRADATGFEMEAALEEAGGRVLYDLRKNTRPLGVIADVSPILGLMGTVLGMIKAFEVVAKTEALGRAELLAEGIAEALLTTAFGLAVAIPAVIFYHYFRGRVDGLLREMEDACLDVMGDLRKQRQDG